MWASSPRRRAAVLAAPLAILLAGCGGDDGGDGSIPQDTSDEMVSLVDEIRTATDNEECDTAKSSTTDLMNEVRTLDRGKTQDTLVEMVEQLDRNLDDECTETGTTDEEVKPKPEEETEPIETTTTTAVEPTTTTTPETTVPEEEEETTPEQPPEEGGGGSHGPPVTPPGQSGGGPPAGGVEAEER